MGLLSVLEGLIKPRNISLSLAILTSITVVIIAKVQEETSKEIIGQLPFCSEENERTVGRRLLYITTLDGKLTALDVSQNGKEHWSVSTSPGSLISSNIHRLELTNNGQMVRMIPSLSGGIYKFDGDSIDPIPVTAENLLSSSFKFSDDLVISGGKETRTYGVSVRTGQILYECNMQGCHNYTKTFQVDGRNQLQEHDSLLDDVIVVRRQTQTIRAVEPRTGGERWNFSVGHHELEVLKSSECHEHPRTELENMLLDLEIKMIIPEGIVCAFNKKNPGVLLWKHQFSSPIVSAWSIDGNDLLKSIDIFDSGQWMWTQTRDNVGDEKIIAPSIYLGMFKKQLYIQESLKMKKLVMHKTQEFTHHLVSSESNLPSIPWNPVPATSSELILITGDEKNVAIYKKLIEQQNSNEIDEDTSVTALSVLYASEYVNGNGFYLYTSEDLNITDNSLCSSNTTVSKNETEDDFNFDFSSTDPPVQIIILSLWFWWKEILVISLTSALVLNLLLAPKMRREREVVLIPVPTALEATEENITRTNSTGRSLSESASNNSENFVSRFQSDFDLMECLGKGGFGVVFQAVNKLDGCSYAIKRITLPNRKEARDRVMREVKTLANCEHQNIVRYFQAWVETPPSGWQESEDDKWLQKDFLSTSIDIETPDGTTLPKLPKDDLSSVNSLLSKNSFGINSWSKKRQFKDKQMNSWFSNQKGNLELEDDSSSFIQFIDERKTEGGNSVAIDIQSQKDHDTSDNDLSDDKSNSLHIEFRNSTNASKQNNDTKSNKLISFNRRSSCSRKRPISLDLTSDGKVMLPLYKKTANKIYLYIQMQLCKKQSLRDWLRENKTESRDPHIKGIFEQIVDAVDYVHLKGLIHRDLKPSNIFFSLDGQIKIGDFGLVTDMSDDSSEEGNGDLQNRSKHTQRVGTHLYMSPEQLEGKPYNFKVDIFSLGLIFFELLRYFDTEMERIVTLRGLRSGKFPINFKDFFPEEFNLLNDMLSEKPEKRPATFQIKEKLSVIIPWKNGSQISEKIPSTCRNEYEMNSNCNNLDEITANS